MKAANIENQSFFCPENTTSKHILLRLAGQSSVALMLLFCKAKYLHSACDLNFHMAHLWGDNPS